MITLSRYSVDEILPLIGHGKNKITLKTHHGTFKVKTNSDRLECFKRSQKCVTCRHNGSIFLLQSNIISSSRSKPRCFIKDCMLCSLPQFYKNSRIEGQLDTPHLNMFSISKSGASLILMTRDHIIPRSKGGLDKIENLQTMCQFCNRDKGSLSFSEFLKSKHNKFYKNSTNGLG
jgi:5-methylcytosine-specific restriction endonuclease McrA